MENELVSIILPIFNIKEEFLRKCITSLRNQTYRNIEIILVDDGSTNNIYEICREYENSDRRIKAIRQNNAGVSVARNNGFEHAKGSYICFVDPDDWVSEQYIEKLFNALKLSDADFIIADCTICYTNHRVDNHFLNSNECDLIGNGKNMLLYQLVGKKICKYYPPEVAAGVPWGKMFRREFLVNNHLMFIPGMIRMQDNIFCLYAIEYAKKIHYLPEKLYFYRKENGSACFKYSPKIVEYFEKYFDETIKFLDTCQKEEIMYRAFYMKELTSFNSFLGQYFFHKENPKSRQEVTKEITNLLSQERYARALEKVDYSLLNKQEQIFVFLMKHKAYLILRILIRIRSKFKM